MHKCLNDDCGYVFLPKYDTCPKCGTPLPTEFNKLVDKLMKVSGESNREKLLEEAGIDTQDKLFTFLKKH